MHTQLSTLPGPSSPLDPAADYSDDLLPARQEDSSCSDVSPAGAGARQICSWHANHCKMTHCLQHTCLTFNYRLAMTVMIRIVPTCQLQRRSVLMTG